VPGADTRARHVRRRGIGATTFPLSDGTQGSASEMVHVIDEEAERVYLALNAPLQSLATGPYAFFATSSDSGRPVTRFAAFDELAFDRGDAVFAAWFPQATPSAVDTVWETPWERRVRCEDDRLR